MDPPTELQLYFSNLVTTFGAYEYIFATCDLLLNSFHVYILSRRHMRTSSMNSILLGIALVDMMFPVIAIKKQLRIWIVGTGTCTVPEGWLENNIDWLLYTLRDDFRRCSTWLGLSLSAVRTIAIRNSLKQGNISTPSFGWKVVAFVVGFSTFLSIFYYLRFKVVPSGTYWSQDPSCPDYFPGNTAPTFIYQEQELYKIADALLRKIYFITVGVLAKFLPCILFPVFAVVLIRELAKAKAVREKAKQERSKKDLTTRLVIYMTVSFFIIEFPIGICFWIEAVAKTSNNGSVATSIIQLLNMIYVVMTLTHFLICFFMSTQYRRTVKNTFFKRSKPSVSGVSVFSVVQNQNLKSNNETSAFQ